MKVINALKKINRRNASVAVLGLSYKANVDDIRESPSIAIIKNLLKHSTRLKKIFVVEPNLSTLTTDLHNKIVIKTKLNYAIKNADIVLILVAHKEFKNIKIKQFRKNQLIIDTKNVLQCI